MPTLGAEVEPGRIDDPAGLNPGPRADAVIRVDEVTGTIWLFGGRTSQGLMNDLWSFSMTTGEWTLVSQGTEGDPPPLMYAAGMMISPTDGSIFLVSGTRPGTQEERVWRFYHGAWHRTAEFTQ